MAAVHAYYGDVTLTNSTISGNSADGRGGGVYTYYGEVTLSNTILSGNTGDNFSEFDATISATYSVLGMDVSSNYGSFDNSNPISDSPGLDPLADNGCTTPAGAPGNAACVQTRALQDGSPALDAANNAVCAADPINNLDQRGVTRPQGSICDIGAYERLANTSGGPNKPQAIPLFTVWGWGALLGLFGWVLARFRRRG